jgi:putative ABC transport system ATP-binding protein
MDEPTGNLDSRSADRILALVRGVVSRGITVITVTHDPIVRSAGDVVIAMRDGHLQVVTEMHE